MPEELVVPSIVISLALVFYTLGVWGERLRRDLLPWHLAAFWLGLGFDAAGTYLMELLLEGIRWDLHTLTGITAFLLMLAHAAWATWVLLKGTDQARRDFHRFSMVVWLLWLVPYLGGMAAGMGRGL